MAASLPVGADPAAFRGRLARCARQRLGLRVIEEPASEVPLDARVFTRSIRTGCDTKAAAAQKSQNPLQKEAVSVAGRNFVRYLTLREQNEQ
jgi:hypothetical protein